MNSHTSWVQPKWVHWGERGCEASSVWWRYMGV